MTDAEKIGFTKRQIRITERIEKAIQKRKLECEQLQRRLIEAQRAVQSFEDELHRINELGDCL